MAYGTVLREELELLSDLVDDELTQAQRREVLRRVESDAGLYETLVEATLYREATGAVGLSSVRRSRAVWMAGFLASVLLAVVVVPRAWEREPLSAPALGRDLVAQDRLAPALATAGWFEQGWSVPGGTTVVAATQPDTAFRIGVQLVALEVALRTGRPTDSGVLAARLDALLSRADLPQLAMGYGELERLLASHGEEDAVPLEALELGARLVALVSRDPSMPTLNLAFGRWAEAGRLAGRSGNTSLLENDAFRDFHYQLAGGDFSPAIDTELERLRDLLRPGLGDLRLFAIESSFQAIIAEG